MKLSIEIDADRLMQALLKQPKVLADQLNFAIFRTVQEMARAAKEKAPKAHSVLTQSIHAAMEDRLTGIVAPAADYAPMVERGTKAGGSPSDLALLDWIKIHKLTPRDPADDLSDLVYLISRSIYKKGTPPQPYLGPAFEAHAARAEQLIDDAINRALAA